MTTTLPILILQAGKPYSIPGENGRAANSGRKVKFQIINGDPAAEEMGSAVIDQAVPVSVGEKIPDEKGPFVMWGAFEMRSKKVTVGSGPNAKSVDLPTLVLVNLDAESVHVVNLPSPKGGAKVAA